MARIPSEKFSELHGDSDPAVEKDVGDNNPKTEALHGSNDKISNRDEDETRNNEEEQAPQSSVHSIFSPRMKIFLVLMTTFSTIFSPLSSFIYLPAITPIARPYHHSLGEINLTITVYHILQAVAPLFFGDPSDQIGRRLVYILTFAIYIAANIGLELQHSYAALLVLRALQSMGSSATVAIGSAVIADITTSAERGGYITPVQASTMFAPVLGTSAGWYSNQVLGLAINLSF